MNFLKGLGQAGEGPEVNAGLRLVKDHEAAAARQHRRDLDALDLAAGKAGIHVAVDIVAGAQADLGQVAAGLVVRHGRARRDVQQVAHLHSLEARRLLEAVGNAEPRAFGDGERGDVLPVPENGAGGSGIDAHNGAGKAGLAAAVRAGDDHKALVVYRQADVAQDVRGTGFVLDAVGKVFDF